jgi:hypothetical protein
VETTETQSLTVESAADLLVQPEESSEVSEEVLEAEDAQPEEDAPVEAEGDDEDTEDDTEESVVDSDEEDEYESEENEPAEEDPQGAVFTVKVDGEEVEVTLDQLKQGYSGQKYVQKGMQQAAEARKQAEAVYTALAQERQNLQQLVAGIQQGGITPPVEPSRELFHDDPIGYMEAKLEYDDKVTQWNAVQQQLSSQSQAEAQARQEHARREAQVLMDKIPELRDAKTAAQFKNDIVHAATEYYGFPEEVLGNITNHNELLVLRDAMLYRKMMANGDTVKSKAKKARPVIKPGTKKVTTNQDVVRKQRTQLKKSGSVEDALALMFK